MCKVCLNMCRLDVCSCAVEEPVMSPLKSSRDIITHNDQGRRPPIPICNSINLKQMKEQGFFLSFAYVIKSNWGVLGWEAAFHVFGKILLNCHWVLCAECVERDGML